MTTPVDHGFVPATPAIEVTSSNSKLPLFKYSLFGPLFIVKYKSGNPSLFTSPMLTPPPL